MELGLEINQIHSNQGFLSGSVVKNPSASARDTGSIPGSGRSLGVGIETHTNILAWRIPWTEEPGGLQSMGPQSNRHFTP